MKQLIALLFVIVIYTGWSQTKVSVSNGSWHNAQTWSPPGDPNFEDSVIVNHTVTVEQITEVWIDNLIISSTGILDSDSLFAFHGSLEINGELYADTLAIGDGNYFINNNLIDAGLFLLGYTVIHENYGEIIVADTFAIGVDFLNATGATIDAYFFATSGSYTENNGNIFTDSWINAETMGGNGRICIENCFQNVGSLEGTLDICDATPNSGLPCDFDFGTTASTVTFCANGACSETSGLSSSAVISEVEVFPNPSSDGRFTIETDAEIVRLKVIDLMGRLLVEKSVGELKMIDLSSMENGEYLLVLETENAVIKKRIVKSN